VSWRVVDHVFKCSRVPKGLKNSGTLQSVLLAIADQCRRDDGTGCFPGVPLIAHGARLSERQTRRAIAKLEALGALVVERLDGRSNRYRVVVEPAVTPDVDVTPDITATPDISVPTPDISALDPCHLEQQPLTPVSHEPVRTIKSNRVGAVSGALSRPRPTVIRDRSSVVVADDQALVEQYAHLWEQCYGTAPRIDWSRDRKAMQQLLQQHSRADVESALGAYFRTSDDWLLQNRHPLPTFRSQFNRYLPTQAPKLAGLSAAGRQTAVNLQRWAASKMAAAGGER
jgi:hypothetical protein